MLFPLAFFIFGSAFLRILYSSHPYEIPPIKGQLPVNALRHAAAVSSLPSVFGRQKSFLLSRAVVPLRNVWHKTDPFVRMVLAKPSHLDWYSADVGGLDNDRSAITINGAFSCIDRGQASSDPITWFVATNLTSDIEPNEGVGGFKRRPGGSVARHDITAMCWAGRAFEPNRRMVEHLEEHRGSGVRFLEPETDRIDQPQSVVGDVHIFEELRRTRQSSDDTDEVVYHYPSGIPVTVSLGFDSGFRILPSSPTMTTEITLEYHVPMLPLAALSSHFGARLEESRVARGQSRTSNLLLLVTTWATGLALTLGIYVLSRAIMEILADRTRKLEEMTVEEVIRRGADEWGTKEWGIVFVHLLGVIFLTGPIAQAAVEGLLDPRQMYEVTTGATVLYGDQKERLSDDPTNSFAGSAFVVTLWMTVRKLDDGFHAALGVSIGAIFLLALVVVGVVTKRTSETMAATKPRWGGMSLWKLWGWMWLKWRGVKGRNPKKYMVFLKIRKGEEDERKEIGMMTHQSWRAGSNRVQQLNAVEKASRELGKEALWKKIESAPADVVGVLGKVRLDDRTRFDLTTVRKKRYWTSCPREFEYIRRGSKCKGLEYYTTNGVFPPDKSLLLIAMGGLGCGKFVEEVVWWEGGDGEVDDDRVRSWLVLRIRGRGRKRERSMRGSEGGVEYPLFRQIQWKDWGFAEEGRNLFPSWSSRLTAEGDVVPGDSKKVRFIMEEELELGDSSSGAILQ